MGKSQIAAHDVFFLIHWMSVIPQKILIYLERNPFAATSQQKKKHILILGLVRKVTEFHVRHFLTSRLTQAVCCSHNICIFEKRCGLPLI